MITEIKTGDLCDATETIVAHGVNCQGSFGSGVAGAIKRRHPKVAQAYLDAKEHQPGSLICVPYKDQIWVHAHTQEQFGYDGQKYASYQLVQQCMRELLKLSVLFGVAPIAMPKIGCGLGGLEWGEVQKIINYELMGVDVFIYELEQTDG